MTVLTHKESAEDMFDGLQLAEMSQKATQWWAYGADTSG